MNEKLIVGVLGTKNSGKTYTWNTLFGRTVKTGKRLRKLFLTKNEYINVFLVNGSPAERHKYVGDIITVDEPKIILCSLQYTKEVIKTIEYFIDNGYYLYIHWLNPGFHEEIEPPLFYSIGIINRLLATNSMVGIRNAKTNTGERIQELKDFIYGWAKSRHQLSIKK
ncbi:MAG: transmembrane 9 family protein [Chlorobi bacterium]|nr:transmembrane 9 family protein [Chlorobiota bacterium]